MKTTLFRCAWIACVLCIAVVMPCAAQQFTTLLSFDRTDGQYPSSPLVQGLDGNFYGTTNEGGTFLSGTFSKVTPSGQLTKLHDFNPNTDGGVYVSGLALATNGSFYGTATQGGANLNGTVFQVTPAGKFTTLYSFCALSNCADGSTPVNGLVQASDGNLYGASDLGGANGFGTIFRMSLMGKMTIIYSFCAQANCTDGDQPIGTLIQATDGNLYGTTYAGGAHNGGTVYKITPAGKYSVVYSFCAKAGCADGKNPYGGTLVQGADGNFYGTTYLGGSDGIGAIYKLTPAGNLTILHSFNVTDGQSPNAGLIQATDGNFYGMTSLGGANNLGTLFKITSAGKFTTLYQLCSESGCADGSIGYGGLMQSTNGTLYGAAQSGGTSTACPGGISGCGTIFSLGMGLRPFVESLPTTGKVGATVLVLGNNLTGATSVTFNGTPATFTIVSGTEIKTTVPTGATTGKIVVTTPAGTLTSNVAFRVRP